MAGEIVVSGSQAMGNYSGGKKKKKKKKGKGNGDDLFADEVQDMAIDTGIMVLGEKFVMSGQLAAIDANESIPKERKSDEKRNYCLKVIVASAIVQRFVKRSSFVASAARSARAVAAVNLGQIL